MAKTTNPPMKRPLRNALQAPATSGTAGASAGAGFGGYDLPQPPTGYSFIVDSDGSYLLDSDGAFLIEVT